MLRLNNIIKSFLQRGTVLDNLSLEIAEGDSVAITGPSGSGKTTLLNIIGLLDRPDSGEVLFRGESIAGYDPDRSADYRNRNIGFVFQDHLLLPYLTVRENILLPLLASSGNNERYTRHEKYALELMEITGIDSISNKYPFNISGGEAQRVTLVRALVNRPALLIADEPTGSLDTNNAELLGKLLVELNADTGVTMILATHSLSLAGMMKRQLVLTEGKLVEANQVL